VGLREPVPLNGVFVKLRLPRVCWCNIHCWRDLCKAGSHLDESNSLFKGVPSQGDTVSAKHLLSCLG